MNPNDEQESNSNEDDVAIARLVLAHLDEIGFKDREVTVNRQRQVKYSVLFKLRTVIQINYKKIYSLYTKNRETENSCDYPTFLSRISRMSNELRVWSTRSSRYSICKSQISLHIKGSYLPWCIQSWKRSCYVNLFLVKYPYFCLHCLIV